MTRGGPRPHAGRKPTGTTLRLIAIRLEPELIAKAKDIGDGVLVEGIRRALRHYQTQPPTDATSELSTKLSRYRSSGLHTAETVTAPMEYIIMSGPETDQTSDGKIITFAEVITAMMKEGWRPQGGVSIMHLTGASAVAVSGEESMYHGVHYLAQAMVHDDDNAKIPGIAIAWF